MGRRRGAFATNLKRGPRVGPDGRKSPFRIYEKGQPGWQTAVAELTCPKCGKVTPFIAADETEDGGFVCPQCDLSVEIRGTRLSEYQQQLNAIDAELGRFSGQVEEKVKEAAEKLASSREKEGPDDESA